MGSDEADFAANTKQERGILLQVLLLDVLLAGGLAAAGAFAYSSGLLANALDNGSDAAVYALSLVAAGRLWVDGGRPLRRPLEFSSLYSVSVPSLMLSVVSLWAPSPLAQ